MKHLVRWLICLGFLLNTAAFITLIALGIAGNTVLLAIALVCYPLSMLLIRLAKLRINSKCSFYQDSDPIWWKIIKTLLMPIVASGALIMFHLITTTFRLMNDAVEDSTGFSMASIIRTAKGFVLYFVAGMILYFINGAIFDGSYRAEDAASGLLIFGGLIWLVDHILWDVLDFAHKESDTFIRIKNFVFLGIALLCAAWGFLMFASLMPKEKKLADLVGQFGMMIAPLSIHMFYYGVARTGRVPQSKMVYFWGPIAMAASYLLILLGALAGTAAQALVLVIYIVLVLASIAALFFLGMPFFYSDGEYRLVYREIAKDQRIARARAAEASSSGYAGASAGAQKTASNAQIYDAVFAASNAASSHIHINAIASVSSIRVFPQRTEADDVSYDVYLTLNVDLRGKEPSDAEYALNGIRRDLDRKMEDFKRNLYTDTARRLHSIGVDISATNVSITFHREDNIITD